MFPWWLWSSLKFEELCFKYGGKGTCKGFKWEEGLRGWSDIMLDLSVSKVLAALGKANSEGGTPEAPS